jgi:hypothetical protein
MMQRVTLVTAIGPVGLEYVDLADDPCEHDSRWRNSTN